MFDIGWTEMLVVAMVAIIVVGPKDLPKMLRTFGKTMKSIRGLAGDFQKQFDEAVKEAELDEIKDIATGDGFKPLEELKSSANALKKDMKDSMAGVEKSVKDGLPDNKLGDKLPAPAKSKSTPAKTTKSKSATKKAISKTGPKSAGKPKSIKTASKPVKSSGTKTVSKKTAPKKLAQKKPTKNNGAVGEIV